MLKEHSRFFEHLMLLGDLLVIACCWLFAYAFRFYGPIPVYQGIPPFTPYLFMLVAVLVIWAFAFRAFGLYRPRRISSRIREVWDIAKASSVAVLLLMALTFLYRGFSFSRLVFLLFWGMSILSLSLFRVLFRELLRFFRRRGYNLRYALVVGTGETAQKVLEAVRAHPELGIRIAGLLGEEPDLPGKEFDGARVLGTYEEIQRVIAEKNVDQVFIALPLGSSHRLEEILRGIGDAMVDIKVIPDFHRYVTLRGGVEEFEGLPFISLQDSPLYGWNLVTKRAMDILFSALALLLASPLMAGIAIAIKFTSKGPILYRQERMGLDGQVFQMLKFRTMHQDAELETGPVWAKPNDPRRTAVGKFLRRTSLDELPQLWNVLKGEMSLVGPRPERPVFVEEFRRHIPRYMLRHKMKAGLTGWAQVNGWRGDTSLEKRIEHDLYYIEHWSLLFDLKILGLTLWKGMFHRNAY
ncbi:MAG: undecaprenyl-phosphate glucose phosphotransferase [Candidatus Methylomirabilales bacterium]